MLIGCMDRRLNLFLDRLADASGDDAAMVVRNAGGCVAGALGTIESASPTEIECYTHTDCGAMRVALAACAELGSGKPLDGTESSPGIYDTVIAPLSGRAYGSASEIEAANTEVQRACLASLAASHPGMKYGCELVDLGKLNVPKPAGEHVLAIGTAFSGRYAELSARNGLEVNGTYFVQANTIDEVLPPSLLAIDKLGLRRVVFLSAKERDNEILQQWASSKPFEAMFRRHGINPEIIGL